MVEAYELIYYPLISEKAVSMINKENKVTFIVNDKATKTILKKAIEEAYAVKIVEINILRDQKGRKKAIVKIDKKFKAEDLATKLGVI